MRNIKPFLVALLIFNYLSSKGQTAQWGHQIITTSNLEAIIYSIATDGENQYVTGCFAGNIGGPGPIVTSTGKEDIFLMKIDKKGQRNWVKSGGGSLAIADVGRCVVYDKQGYLYVTGSVSGTSNFDNSKSDGRGLKDIFLAKYDTTGKILWVKNFGGAGDDEGAALDLDSEGNIILVGYYSNKTANFGSFSVKSFGGKDIFISKLTSEGEVIWVRRAGNAMIDDQAFSVKVDPDDNILVVGGAGVSYFEGQYNSDEIGFSPLGQDDAFLAKYDKDGIPVFVNRYGGRSSDKAFRVGLDNEGNIYVGGTFKDTVTFYNEVLGTIGSIDEIFVLKTDPEGKTLWAKSAGGSKHDYLKDMFVTENGDVFICGYLSSLTGSFMGVNFKINGTFDAYVSKISSNGNLKWFKKMKGSNWAMATALSFNQSKDVFTGFGYSSSASVDVVKLAQTSNGLALLKIQDYDVITSNVNEQVEYSISYSPEFNSIINPDGAELKILMYDILGRKIFEKDFTSARQIELPVVNELSIVNVKSGTQERVFKIF